MPKVRKNKEREKANATVVLVTGKDSTGPSTSKSDPMDNILDIREYDVPYYVRVSIDTKINVVSKHFRFFSILQEFYLDL